MYVKYTFQTYYTYWVPLSSFKGKKMKYPQNYFITSKLYLVH